MSYPISVYVVAVFMTFAGWLLTTAIPLGIANGLGWLPEKMWAELLVRMLVGVVTAFPLTRLYICARRTAYSSWLTEVELLTGRRLDGTDD